VPQRAENEPRRPLPETLDRAGEPGPAGPHDRAPTPRGHRRSGFGLQAAAGGYMLGCVRLRSMMRFSVHQTRIGLAMKIDE
jgi:hypothetical protein